jgi:formate--tetrahydrofolate ligase
MDGGAGAVELAEAVVEAAEEPTQFQLLYPDEADLRTKIATIATRVYGADDVEYTPAAAKQLATRRSSASGGYRSAWRRPTCRCRRTRR